MSINNQGMNWIRQTTRLAIYLRDGLACAYCGDGLESGARLTLDHVHPFVRGGRHQPMNLVTACERCNVNKNDRELADWICAVTEYVNHGLQPTQIAEHIERTTSKPLAQFRVQAREMIATRGSAARVIRRLRRTALRTHAQQ